MIYSNLLQCCDLIFIHIDKIKKSEIRGYLVLDQRNISLSVILVPSIMIFVYILFGQFVSSYYNDVSVQYTFAQNSDVKEPVQKELLNKTKLISSYESLLSNNYPYPIRFVQNLQSGPAIIHDGIVILKNSKSEDIHFSEWGEVRNLNLYNFSGPNKNITLLYIEGSSPDYPSGFMSEPIRSSERYISLNFGSMNKDPETAQATIQLEIVGNKDKYYLDFVSGRLGYEGWRDNTFYKKITTNSSHLIDLDKFLSPKGDQYSYVEKINIIVEKDTQVDILQFRIDLGNSTVNTPAVLGEGKSYFVNGYSFQGVPLFNEYKYLFDDWKFKKVLSQGFMINESDPSVEHAIATNEWNIIEEIKSENNSSNTIYIKMLSEKTFSLWDLPILDVLAHLDIYNSVISFGSPQEILFVVVISILIVFALYNSSGNKVDTHTVNE